MPRPFMIPAGGDNRRRHIFGQQGSQGHGPDQALLRLANESAAMATRLGALGDNEIDPNFLQHNGFQQVSGRCDDGNTGFPQ